MRALEQDSHIISETESINFRNTFTDLIGINTTEERIPETVRVTPFVIFVASTRIGVKNTHTILALRNTIDSNPITVTITVAAVLRDPCVGTIFTSTFVGLARIIVPLTNIREVTTLIGRIVD